MEKLRRAKAVLDAADVPTKYRILYTSLRRLRQMGLTPLEIQERLRDGTLVKTERLP